MKEGFHIEWEAEGFNSRKRINACLSELKHLSSLRTLEIVVSDPIFLPEDDMLFDNLSLTRYTIVIGNRMVYDGYKASRRLILDGFKSFHPENCLSKLLKRS